MAAAPTLLHRTIELDDADTTSDSISLKMALGQIRIARVHFFMQLIKDTRDAPPIACNWTTLLGLIVFREMPDNWAVVGAAIVIASGIYTFYRENKRRAAERVAQEAVLHVPA